MIIDQLVELDYLKAGEEVPRIKIIPPPQKANFQSLAESLKAQLPVYSVPKGEILQGKISGAEKKMVREKLTRVVFTGLGGVLLHPLTNSYSKALDSLRMLQENRIPIVFCSSKARVEQQSYRDELDIKSPFVVESGGAIFIPRDYFRLPFTYDRATKDYLVIEIGITLQEILKKLRKLEQESKIQVTGFSDMGVEEIARDTALDLRLAEYAKQREYSEILSIKGKKKDIEFTINSIKKLGLGCVSNGKFYEITAGNDMDKAIQILTALYKLNFGNTLTVGIGVDENDTATLAAVDLPILVQGQAGRWRKVKIKDIWRVRGVGPEGWNRAITELVTKQIKQDTIK
jgi:mannosyl-3-phosphoglycerate synthase